MLFALVLAGFLVLVIIYYVSKATGGRFYDNIHNPSEYKDTGSIGERNIYRKLSKHFPEAQILRNVYLHKKDGKLTEIDMLLVTRKGIFVIESKNYSGWIYGKEHDSNWTQTFPNGMKFKFFNPIRQNHIHVLGAKNTLAAFFEMRYFSIVVFGDECKIKNVSFSPDNTRVIKLSNLISTINDILSSNTEVITEDELNRIVNLLVTYSRPDKAIKEQHMNQFAENSSECPSCGSFLIKRWNSNTGETFWGCKGFPKCRFTSNEEI